jgi:hypothetical protein
VYSNYIGDYDINAQSTIDNEQKWTGKKESSSNNLLAANEVQQVQVQGGLQ